MSTWRTKQRIRKPAGDPSNWLPALAIAAGVVIAGALVALCAIAWGYWR